MSIGGYRQEVLGGAQNHLDGLRGVREGRGVRVPPPSNLDPLKQSESLRYMVKGFGAPGGVDSRHAPIMPGLCAAGRVEILDSKGYMSSSCRAVLGGVAVVAYAVRRRYGSAIALAARAAKSANLSTDESVQLEIKGPRTGMVAMSVRYGSVRGNID